VCSFCLPCSEKRLKPYLTASASLGKGLAY
jgi:hypothetical protein